MDEKAKNLYLEGKRKTVVVLDGPSLRIRRDQLADQLVPLRKIRLVNSFGCVQWETPALLACADRDIEISFCRQDGSLRATLHGKLTPVNASHLVERLIETLEDGEKTESLRQWIQNYNEMVTRDSLHRLWGSNRNVNPDNIQALQRSMGTIYMNSQEWRKLRGIINSLLISETKYRLRQDGIDEHMPLLQLRNITLAREIATVNERYLLPLMLSRLKKQSKKHRNRPCNISIFERAIKHFEYLRGASKKAYDEYLLQMHRHLLESG